MNLPNSLVSYLGDVAGTSAQLIDMLLECSEIMSEIKKAREQHDTAKAKYESEAAMLSDVVSGIQARCPHYRTVRRYDPVDSSDNYDECDICGLTAHRITAKQLTLR